MENNLPIRNESNLTISDDSGNWFIFCILKKKAIKRDYFLKMLLMIITAVVIYVKTCDNVFIFTVLFIYGIKDLDYEKIVKRYAVTQLLCVIGILLVYFVGMSENVVSYFAYGTKYSLGTYHANNFATLALSCYMAVCYCYLKNRIKTEIVLTIVIAQYSGM